MSVKTITEADAYAVAWGTFIPTPMPSDFFSREDDVRYSYYGNHVYPIFSDISYPDIEGTIESLAKDILEAQKTYVSEDTIESLAKEMDNSNDARHALSLRTNAKLIPLSDELIALGDIDKLNSIVNAFPPCPTRMILAAKIDVYRSKKPSF